MRTVKIGRAMRGLATMGLVLAASFCASQEKQAMTRSSEDRKSTRLNSSHLKLSRMPSSA